MSHAYDETASVDVGAAVAQGDVATYPSPPVHPWPRADIFHR
jgi:hypothetical protein